MMKSKRNRNGDRRRAARSAAATTPSRPPLSLPVRGASVPVAARDTVQWQARDGYDGNSALTLYLTEVGQVALLTPAQEVELAARIKKGDETAREHMIRANLRLVVKIARDYEGLGLPLLDLINEGNIGLMKAVERFDPAKGAKLSSYSSWWIKQSMRRALANQSKTIRLPVHAVDKLYHLRRAEARLQELFRREPTDDELAAEVGMTVARIAELRLAALRPASLDAKLSDEDSNQLSDVVEDEQAEMPYEQIDRDAIFSLLREFVKKLNPREASIIKYRFGLDGGSEKTLEDVGRKFGVTRERIRQLQCLALTKLRRMLAERDSLFMAA